MAHNDLRERLYFNQTFVGNFGELVGCYSRDELASPFRSTVPLLSLVRDGQAMLHEIVTQCSIAEQPSLHFEFQVPPPKGRGKASHTDLMLCAQSGCMAVEAKWTEPPYQTVREWLGDSSRPGELGRDNRHEVLSGWLSLLQPMAVRTLVAQDVMSVIYQTVHRAASACHLGTPPQLAYLQFVSDTGVDAATHEKRLVDLRSLRVALGNGKSFPFRLIEIKMQPTSAFDELSRLPKGRETGSKVKEALTSRPLFVFTDFRLHDVADG